MNRIEKKFDELRKEGKKAFIPYITAGDPNLSITEKLVFELEKRGVSLIELGVPFSDPLADGPTIQRAGMRALKNGTTLTKIIALVKRIREKVRIPICLMTYYNPVFRYGLNKFAQHSSEAGVDGVIIPDLPAEESLTWIKLAKEKNIDTIFLLSPTSNYDRIKLTGEVSSGFIYYVSLTGVTGEREKLDISIEDSINRIKKIVSLPRQKRGLPVCVGFGISKREHIEKLCKGQIDGIIIGSAIIKIIEYNKGSRNIVERVGNFVAGLMKGM